MSSELKDWLTLINAPGLGATRLIPLLKRYRHPAAICRLPRNTLSEHRFSELSIDHVREPDEALIEAHMEWLDRPGHSLITYNSDDYPPALRHLPRPPIAIFCDGNTDALWMPQVAVVGSRHATRGGLENAQAFSRAMAKAGLVIVSGMALGVDGAAHAAAMDAGGLTVAVAGTGLDQVYPRSHADLAARIRDNGCIISEYPPGTSPRAGHFPQRNRLIAALGVGCLVVEAGVQSGSLITARLAMELNRDVFAIPGSIHNPVARGCHRLIKDGAKLVETGADVLDELGGAIRSAAAEARDSLQVSGDGQENGVISTAIEAPEHRLLLDAMGFDPITVDRLVDSSGLTVDAVSSMLLIMELDGKVESLPGGKYCRTG